MESRAAHPARGRLKTCLSLPVVYDLASGEGFRWMLPLATPCFGSTAVARW